jgi:hypothetical protein
MHFWTEADLDVSWPDESRLGSLPPLHCARE